jgi:transposase
MEEAIMGRGRKPLTVTITEPDRERLQEWARRPKTAQALALRARIVLRAAEGIDSTQIARELGVHPDTPRKWRARFAQQDEPRPGQPRKLSDGQIEAVIRRTLESKPAGATHWSTRSMAQACGLNQTAVSRIWRAFALQPHRSENFKLSKDPLFIDKVRDIVGLYLNPPDRALVLCVDEKSQIQALERTQPLLPLRPGQAERRAHDYKRHGTTSWFAALDTKTGTVLGKTFRRHRAQEFRQFLDLIEENVPANLEIHLILDNSATHKTAAIRRWLLKRPQFHVHFTPTSSSWLNLVERWFAALTQRQLRRNSFRSTVQLEQAIREFLAAHNSRPKPFVWTKTADQILDSIARYCRRINDSGH